MKLQSKQVYNLKDKNLGETCKRISVMNDVSEIVSNSAILINYLNNDPDAACIAQCQQLSVEKDLHYHVKLFGTTGPIDVLVDKINFPQK